MIEIALWLFSIGIEVHFTKQWLQKRPTLATHEVDNYLEDCETEVISLNRCVNKFKLANKHVGIVLHDTEDGDETYDEVRKTCAVLWDHSTWSFKVNT